MSEPVTTQARLPRAWVSYSIIALCVVIYALEWAYPQFLGQIALSAASGAVEPWRYLTSAFAHAKTPVHILFNMYALWVLGPSIEQFIGRSRFLLLYLISALAGSVAFVWTSSPQDWVVGASGAVFGLFGAMLVFNRLVGLSSKSLIIVVALNFVLGFVIPNIAWQAHLGGFLAGVLAAVLVAREIKSRVAGGRHTSYGWLALLALVLAALAAARNFLG